MPLFLVLSSLRMPTWLFATWLFATWLFVCTGLLTLGMGLGPVRAQEPAETQPADVQTSDEVPVEEPETEAISELRQALYKAVNATRASAGARPVDRDSGFESVVRAHARDMVARTYMAHRSPDGDGPRERVLARFPDFLGIAGENIAMRTHREGESAADTATAAVEAWMDSPPHRKNLLDQRHGFAGISAADNGRAIYIVMLLTSEPSLRPPEPDPIPQPRPESDAADTGQSIDEPVSLDPQLPDNRGENAPETAGSPAPGS